MSDTYTVLIKWCFYTILMHCRCLFDIPLSVRGYEQDKIWDLLSSEGQIFSFIIFIPPRGAAAAPHVYPLPPAPPLITSTPHNRSTDSKNKYGVTWRHTKACLFFLEYGNQEKKIMRHKNVSFYTKVTMYVGFTLS
jgi:hypothetical protein